MSSPSILIMQNYSEASDEIVTNCDVGPSCGMAELVGIAAALFVVIFCVGLIQGWRN